MCRDSHFKNSPGAAKSAGFTSYLPTRKPVASETRCWCKRTTGLSCGPCCSPSFCLCGCLLSACGWLLSALLFAAAAYKRFPPPPPPGGVNQGGFQLLRQSQPPPCSAWAQDRNQGLMLPRPPCTKRRASETALLLRRWTSQCTDSGACRDSSIILRAFR
jgi:hypothetical protein